MQLSMLLKQRSNQHFKLSKSSQMGIWIQNTHTHTHTTSLTNFIFQKQVETV